MYLCRPLKRAQLQEDKDTPPPPGKKERRNQMSLADQKKRDPKPGGYKRGVACRQAQEHKDANTPCSLRCWKYLKGIN
jgi:hypothetical protein